MGLTTCKACGHQIATNASTCPNCGHQRAPKTLKIIGLSIMGLAAFMVLVAVVVMVSFSEGDTKQEAATPPAETEPPKPAMTDLPKPTKTDLPKLEILKREDLRPRLVVYDVRPELVEGIWIPKNKQLIAAAVKMLARNKEQDAGAESVFVKFFYPGYKNAIAHYMVGKDKEKFRKLEVQLITTKYWILATHGGCNRDSMFYKTAQKAVDTLDPFVFVETAGPAAISAGCSTFALSIFHEAINSGMLTTKTVEREEGLDFSPPDAKKKARPIQKVTLNYLAMAYGGRGRALCLAAAQSQDKSLLKDAAKDLKKALDMGGPVEKHNTLTWSTMLDGIKTLAPEVLN